MSPSSHPASTRNPFVSSSCPSKVTQKDVHIMQLNRLNKEWRDIQKNNKYATLFYQALNTESKDDLPASATSSSSDQSSSSTSTSATPTSASNLPTLSSSSSSLVSKVEDVLTTHLDQSDVILFPKSEKKMDSWIAFILGPPDTPFENARFMLKIQVPTSYPHSPPVVEFVTPIFHPNVHYKRGEICLDVLKDTWTPSWSLESVCRAILLLLATPQPDSPLNCDAGNLLRLGDVRGYWSMARCCTLDYAIQVTPKHDDDNDDNEPTSKTTTSTATTTTTTTAPTPETTTSPAPATTTTTTTTTTTNIPPTTPTTTTPTLETMTTDTSSPHRHNLSSSSLSLSSSSSSSSSLSSSLSTNSPPPSLSTT